MRDKEKKIELLLTSPTVAGIAGLYVKLTGKPLSPEGLAKLKAGLEHHDA